MLFFFSPAFFFLWPPGAIASVVGGFRPTTTPVTLNSSIPACVYSELLQIFPESLKCIFFRMVGLFQNCRVPHSVFAPFDPLDKPVLEMIKKRIFLPGHAPPKCKRIAS